MSKNILKNAKKLNKKDLKNMVGGEINHDITLCGCDCAGAVTGPAYCLNYMGCPQVYTCNDPIIADA